MKTSWIIGTVSLWFALMLIASVVEATNKVTTTEITQVQNLMQPTGTDVTVLNSLPVIGGFASLITNVWSYLIGFLQMVFFWSPTLWTGNWLWIYLIFVMGIGVGIVMSVVFILRGVHSA
jgi:hypothetical protein